MTMPPLPSPPNIGASGVLQDPGIGGALASSLAQVLAAQQHQQEQQFRQQQLMQQQQEAQQRAQYEQGLLAVQQGQLSAQTTEQGLRRQGLAQVGGAQRAALNPQGLQPRTPGFAQNAAVAAPGTALAPPSGSTTQGTFEQVIHGGSTALAPAAGNPDIFGGVSNENLPAAIEGVQQAQALQPKEPELPASAKEFEYLSRLAQRDPRMAALYKTLFLDKHPQTVINNIPGQGETEFSKELAKAQVALLGEGEKNARTAVSSFPGLNEAYGLVDKSFTGFGAKQLMGLARAAGATGFTPGKDKVRDTQTLLKLTGDQVLVYLRGRDLGSGNAVSDKDRDFMEQLAGRDITQDPVAIKRSIRINVGTNIMKTQDAINDLKDQMIAYPQNAPQLQAKAEGLRRKLAPIEARYAQMLADENMAVEDIRKRLQKIPGLQLPR